MENVTVDSILLAASFLLAVAGNYLPGFKDWLSSLKSEQKQLFMGGLIFVVVAGAFGLSFTDRFEFFYPNVDGMWDAIILFIGCIASNQGGYLITRKSDV